MRLSAVFVVLLPTAARSFAPATTTTVRGSGSLTGSSLRAATPAAKEDPAPAPASRTDEFVVGILGDLHIDPRKMEDYAIGKRHFEDIFSKAKSDGKGVAVVSLGDLGESKNCGHNPESDSELFAGTTKCHEMASEFLGSFGVPYEVVGGNHDLEGLDEFETDRENLDVVLACHGKETPQFCREVADKTLLVGLGSTVFREAIFTSHEVTIDQRQIDWFEDVLVKHPANEGWKIFVFTHAPPNGSGLRVLQENHVVNGCCWLNHSNEKQCKKFIELVREHRCVKAWFSGHFHLGQDYQDSITVSSILYCLLFECSSCSGRSVVRSFVFSFLSSISISRANGLTNPSTPRNAHDERTTRRTDEIYITQFPTIDPKDGPYPNRGSCVFAQTSVMRAGTSRDGRQQSRLIRGNKDGFEICTVDHQKDGKVRLDATVTFTSDTNEVGVYAHEDESYDHDKYFKVYQPNAGDKLHPPDDGFRRYNSDGIIERE
jgi:hypothetical protein